MGLVGSGIFSVYLGIKIDGEERENEKYGFSTLETYEGIRNKKNQIKNLIKKEINKESKLRERLKEEIFVIDDINSLFQS